MVSLPKDAGDVAANGIAQVLKCLLMGLEPRDLLTIDGHVIEHFQSVTYMTVLLF